MEKDSIPNGKRFYPQWKSPFNTAELMFNSAEHKFNTSEHTFNTSERKNHLGLATNTINGSNKYY